MGSERNRFRQFLTAEEVPRWFGLSLVLIYLVGLGSVAQYGIVQARREGAVRYHDACRYAFQSLVDRLSEAGRQSASESTMVGTCQRLLRQFAVQLPTQQLRLVDDTGRVVASIDPNEIGRIVPRSSMSSTLSDGISTGKIAAAVSLEPMVYRARLIPWEADAGTSGAGRPSIPGEAADGADVDDGWPTRVRHLVVEAVISPAAFHATSAVRHVRVLAIVLIVLGALFVVYRALREHLRGLSRIGERLQEKREFGPPSFHRLRIEGSLDDVTSAWNELIDLIERYRHDAEQREANLELSRVLKNASGGALAEALNSMPDAMIYVQEGNRFSYLNAAACRLFGWSQEEAKSKRLSDVATSEVGGKVLALLKETIGSGEGLESCSRLLEWEGDDDQRAGTYRISLYPLRRGRHAGDCMVMVRDISQQQRADRAREEFITQVTHELRTPLTNIRAYTETLSSGMFDDPKIVTECYNVITKETRRLSRLIEDILSVSQLELGSMELSMGSVDVGRLLTESVRDVRNLAEERDIDLQLVLPPKLEEIQADRDKLAVVINNLLGNAIKYTSAGGNIIVGCQMQDKQMVITVKDNGIGIAPEDRARVFEKFQRANDPEAQNVCGTGIGLFTVREIIRRHGGVVDLISEKGVGSTFLVRLPHRPSRAVVLSTTQEA